MTREEILSAARQAVKEGRGYGEAEEFTREEIREKLARMARKYAYHAANPGPGATEVERRNLRLKAAALAMAVETCHAQRGMDGKAEGAAGVMS